MLELIQMVVLAIVQGLTEFLPVSSSGHLVLTQALLGAHEGDIFFDVVLHLGTLGSVCMVYRREIVRLLKFDAQSVRYLLALAVGTVPAVLVGLFFKDLVEGAFQDPVFAAFGLLATAAILISTRFAADHGADRPNSWEPDAPPLAKAFLIGCSQALAIMPGISRSGSTISTSLWLGLKRGEAARFSFLLSIPAIGGALVLQLADRPTLTTPWLSLVFAALVAFGFGLLALRWTALAVVQAHFWKFSFYCAAAGVVALLVLR